MLRVFIGCLLYKYFGLLRQLKHEYIAAITNDKRMLSSHKVVEANTSQCVSYVLVKFQIKTKKAKHYANIYMSTALQDHANHFPPLVCMADCVSETCYSFWQSSTAFKYMYKCRLCFLHFLYVKD